MFLIAVILATEGISAMIKSNYIRGRGTIVLIKRQFKINFRIVAAFVALAALLVSSYAHATTVNNSTNTLKITPVRTDIVVQPGESKVIQTTVTNMTDTAITVRPIQNDFVAGDEWGTPALILDANEYAPTHSLKRFMAPLSDVTIPAKQAETIEVTINVPQDAQAGGYFGAVRFAPTSPEEGGQVNLSASAASLILLTVPGDLVEDIALTDFDITQDGKPGAFFSTSNNIQAAIRFQNKGNVQVGPIGKLSVKQGDEVVYETDFNNKDPRDVILPDSARRWEMPVNKIGSFGKYTVLATFTYGQKNQTIEVTRSFWVVPTGVIIATIVAVLLMFALIIGTWLFLRGYKRRILRKHESSSK